MNRITSSSNPGIVNGENMKLSNFGTVTKSDNPHFKKGDCVYRANNCLVRLSDGWQTVELKLLEICIKDKVTLQRIK